MKEWHLWPEFLGLEPTLPFTNYLILDKLFNLSVPIFSNGETVSYTHLRAHETVY